MVTAYTSTKSGLRFDKSTHRFNEGPVPDEYKWKISVDKNKKYQKIVGFGGALSDAAVLNIGKMSEKVQNKILSDFVSDHGIEYSAIRTTIAGSDFSTCQYTYDDHLDDFELKNFSLVDEDLKLRVN